MRTLWALLILGAVASPAWAHGPGYRTGYRTGYVRGYHRAYPVYYGHRGYRSASARLHARVARFHAYFGHTRRPYWHHPYYLRRYGGYRPYRFHRFARYHGYYPYYGCGYGYYPPAISVAPIYTRLSVVFTLDDPVFDGEKTAAHDGLPRAREGLVGERFLVTAK
ncbi:MAG: hypothetical protein ACYTEZ_19010 [Planctomycetota bacterium]|jgi:hypothetical protein